MIGTPRAHHRVADSTNERARELAAMGAPHGTLVTAEEQTAGRGRQGRTWSAPPGSAVLMSLVLREFDKRHAPLSLAAAVAVCDACDPVACAIKWPNDVVAGGRKLAGVLLEGRPQEGWAVLGIGLNVTTDEADLPEDLCGTATSLKIAARGGPSTAAMIELLIASLDRRLADESAEVLAAWRSRDALRGKPVRWTAGEGMAAGVNDRGALLVDTDGGRVALAAGEVHLLP